MFPLPTCANWESSRPGVTTDGCCPALKWGPSGERLCPLRPSQVAEGSRQMRSLLCRVCIVAERFFFRK